MKPNIKKYLTKQNFRNVLSIFLFILIPICICYLTEFYTHNPLETMKGPIQLLNIVFFELLAVLLLMIFKKGKIALWIETVLFAFIGLANYFVLSFRSAPIMPWDIFSFKTAVSVADNYSYVLDKQAIIVLCLFGVLLVASFFCNTRIASFKIRLSGILCTLLLLTGYANYVQSPKAISDFRLYDKLFTPNTMSYKDGTVVAFMMQLQYMFVEKPKGYSVETAKAILDSYETSETTQLPNLSDMPNIIVIMNEAFSDLNILGDFSTNQDYMPFIHSLLEGAENTQSGYLHASVLGGNTANSEFEFLTGHTMAFLPQGSIPYQQYIKGETFSLTSYLKEMGYATAAIHPYNATGWQRHEVYPWFGFDQFLSLKNFGNAIKIRKYVSDQSNYEKIIELYEKKESGKPLFLFNVTMQNHSSYSESFDNFTPEITVDGSKSVSLSNYLSLLKISDKETEKLVQYFSNQPEKTILVFFGDHQPTDSVVSNIWKLNGKNGSNLSLEDQQLRYQVPFFIWANYDIEEKTDTESSFNYLGVSVLEAAELPLSRYHQFLKKTAELYPIVTPIQIKDANGTSYELKNGQAALQDYSILQYYMLMEKRNKTETN